MLKHRILFIVESLLAFLLSCLAVAISYYISAITVTPFIRLFTEDQGWLYVIIFLVGLIVSLALVSWIMGKFIYKILDHAEKSKWDF